MEWVQRNAVNGSLTVAVAAATVDVALVCVEKLGWLAALLSATGVIYLAVALVGAAIVRAAAPGRPANMAGWVFLVSGVSLPLSNMMSDVARVEQARGLSHLAVWVDTSSIPVEVLGVPLMATFGILLFPDGRLTSPWRRRLGGVYLIELVVLLMWGTCSSDALDGPLTQALILSVLLIGPLSLLACVALTRRAGRDAGQYGPALRVAARCAYLVPVSFLACVVTGFSGGNTEQVAVAENCAAFALGVAAWIGITRYGLFSVRAVVGRTLVYASMSVLLAVVYLLAVAGLGMIFDGVAIHLLAAVTTALVALPLRSLAQTRISQFVYGLRDEPSIAFARLGDRLDAAAAPADILPLAARTVAEALRLRYVSIEADSEILAWFGSPVPGTTRTLPLLFAGEQVGNMVLQARDDVDFTAAEQQLLAGLGRQVAVAARAVRLASDLQASRQRLVSAREEERRRLRRDLHDGLGSTLTGIALGIDTVRRSLPHGTAEADLLGAVRQQTEGAVHDIRRIAYDLRPPILDQLGLAAAVREQAAHLGITGLRVPPALPPLPAAVEVAAYRIAVEALTNATRHAAGSAVSIELEVDTDYLRLSVQDNGPGLVDGYQAGVGLTSMRERAVELGGDCVISCGDPRGTLVWAELPLAARRAGRPDTEPVR